MTSSQPGRLVLLGRFAIVETDRELVVTETCQRLVAAVALHPGPIARERVAGYLWPDEGHETAGARLRTALSRVNRSVPWILSSAHGSLAVCPGIAVDYRHACDVGRALVETGLRAGPCDADIHCFDRDLLPDWDEDWVVQEREAFRQLRFATLEAIATSALRAGLSARAVQACLSIVGAEPLRESAHRLLVEAHAAEGNVGEAIRQVDSYADRLRTELGVPPSSLMIDLRKRLTTGFRSSD